MESNAPIVNEKEKEKADAFADYNAWQVNLQESRAKAEAIIKASTKHEVEVEMVDPEEAKILAQPREYKVSLYSDMGHLMTKPGISEIPKEIYKFVHKKAKNKIDWATDKDGLGCAFYYLKPGLLNEWRYDYKGNNVIIDYSKVGKFDPSYMQPSKRAFS